MKKRLIFGILIIIAVLIGIFVFIPKGTQNKIDESRVTSHESRIEYYTCGMHPSIRVTPEEYNKGKVNCPICNMKLTPVYKEEETEARPTQGKILFYRHPMNPGVTSKVPAKDEMGMDYIPVYEEEEDADYYGCGMEGVEHVFVIKGEKDLNCPICGMPLKKLSKTEADSLRGAISTVKIKGEQARLAGVKVEPVRRLYLHKEIRTVGRVAYDPQLAIAQEEFISSLRALDRIQEGGIAEIKQRALNLVESAKRKLRLLGLSNEQIEELGKKREVQTSLILPEEKMWIYGDIYEYELIWIKAGEEVKITALSLPGEEFHGVISSLNPVVDPKTRSVTFRTEVDNPELKLKPQMYVDVTIMGKYVAPDGEKEVLAIPKNAVLDTGTRKIVWVDKGGQEFESRAIQVGPEAVSLIDGIETKLYPVLKGLSEDEMVVTKANFLIDSQSQISGVAAAAYGGALGVEEKQAPPAHQH